MKLLLTSFFKIDISMTKIRVRFAPSPTGPLHIGGVRTALYNYLFAKKMGGIFILRIEDTDQNRYVEGAEDYIKEALEWFDIAPDEGPGYGGDHGPYRQSERKDLYAQYVEQMVANGSAYYAFDTEEDLNKAREEAKANGNHSFKYNWEIRKNMKNSVSLSEEETKSLLEANTPYTIRLKIPTEQNISFTDVVRGVVSFASNELDDKIIMKGDGMPTYHLANIVDDHLMEISHVIRGEEWLSSTAHHVLMYQFMGWEAPQFAHLPLILNPAGSGKLSKRHGAKFGFPVFPLEWVQEEETYRGFREDGFDADAVVNFLSLLGWSPGTEQEKFTREELIQAFSLEKIVKSGARFDIDKAHWFNQQYLIEKPSEEILAIIKGRKEAEKLTQYSDDFILQMIDLMRERVILYDDFVKNSSYLLGSPTEYDLKTFKKKYKPENEAHFDAIKEIIKVQEDFQAENLSNQVKDYIKSNELGFGAIFPILRIILSGTMKGPDLFAMMELIGKEEVLIRWDAINNLKNA